MNNPAMKQPAIIMPENFQELMDAIGRILPDATFGEDNQGQLIIYTDLAEGQGGNLITFEDTLDPETEC